MRSNTAIRNLGLLLAAPALTAATLVATATPATAAKPVPTISGSGECSIPPGTTVYLFTVTWTFSDAKGRWAYAETREKFSDSDGVITPHRVDLRSGGQFDDGTRGAAGTHTFEARVVDGKGNPLTEWDEITLTCPAD